MRILLFLWVVLLALPIARAQDGSSILQEFENSKVMQGHFYGFALYDMSGDSIVVSKNADKYYTPASNAKVSALYGALKHLGDSIPGLAYKISGDSLIFWGTGDPTFLHPKLCSGRVFNFLKQAPYTLYYAPQEGQQRAYRNGWAIEDYQYAFQPELSTFPIYGNIVRFFEKDSRIASMPAHFENTIKRGMSASTPFGVERSWEQNIFEISDLPIPRRFSSNKPFKYSDELFVKLLSDTLAREIKTIQKTMPPDAIWLYSQSTREILREMMVHSDNFLAEQLAYLGSLQKYGVFDVNRLREDLFKTDYQAFSPLLSLHDESGLSFYNKVTPIGMVKLLLLLDKNIDNVALRNYFFPAGGIDGTLKNTYKLSQGIPFVWAKTGTVHAVYNQSGFVHGKSGKAYAFSFLNNNFHGNLREVRGEVARIMTYIHLNY